MTLPTHAEDVVRRLIRYCSVPTQADPQSTTVPSTPQQFDLAQMLYEELQDLGISDVEIDEHAYVIAHVPASPGLEHLPAIGLCCHIDTSFQSWADPVHPCIRTYEGGELLLGTGRDGLPVTISPETNPELTRFQGKELICTDGTSLLGGDDKAGIAIIMAVLKRYQDNPDLLHSPLALAFVPDEEIGHGAALLDIEKFGASWGFTLDGGPLGECSYETFHAAEVEVHAHGLSVHPGTAKNTMINASELLIAFHQLLPPEQRPEYTDKYEGFYYLSSLEGSCEQGHSVYIIRDHDRAIFDARYKTMQEAAAHLNRRYGQQVISLVYRDQYRNMAEVITKPEYAHLIEYARAAYAQAGIEMTCIPMRGGTDGSQLSFRGFACANLSACYYNAHGVREFVPVDELCCMVDVLQNLLTRYATDTVPTA